MRFAGVCAALAAFANIAFAQSNYVDGPHVTLPNTNISAQAGPEWQWWIFDIIAEDGSSLQVNFFAGFPFGPLESVDPPYRISVTTVLPNGTFENVFEPGSTGIGEVTQSVGQYSNGNWPGIASWTSTEDSFVVNFNISDVTGNLTLTPNLPPRYLCDQDAPPSFTTTVSPNLVGPWLGSTNAVPGASATAYLDNAGNVSSFSGPSGFHQSVFGLQPLGDVVNTWYWGRGIVGPYTFVYWAYLPQNSSLPADDPNAWYTSGYIADSGKPVAEFCSSQQTLEQNTNEHITISTSGQIWDLNPTLIGIANNTQGTVTIDVEFQVDGQIYEFNQTSIDVALNGGPLAPYAKYSSSIQGGKVGEEPQFGNGYFEILKFADGDFQRG